MTCSGSSESAQHWHWHQACHHRVTDGLESLAWLGRVRGTVTSHWHGLAGTWKSVSLTRDSECLGDLSTECLGDPSKPMRPLTPGAGQSASRKFCVQPRLPCPRPGGQPRRRVALLKPAPSLASLPGRRHGAAFRAVRLVGAGLIRVATSPPTSSSLNGGPAGGVGSLPPSLSLSLFPPPSLAIYLRLYIHLSLPPRRHAAGPGCGRSDCHRNGQQWSLLVDVQRQPDRTSRTDRGLRAVARRSRSVRRGSTVAPPPQVDEARRRRARRAARAISPSPISPRPACCRFGFRTRSRFGAPGGPRASGAACGFG